MTMLNHRNNNKNLNNVSGDRIYVPQSLVQPFL